MTQPLNPPYDGATLEQLKNENVQQFLYLHNYLRSEMQMLRQLIDELTEGEDAKTADYNQTLIQSLIRAGSNYAQHLHAHHHGETALMFPLLKREGLDTDIVERLNREHDELGGLIDNVTTALLRMKSVELPQIKTDLRQLSNALRTHLEYEESHVCPLLAHWESPAKLYADLFTGSRN